MNSEPVRPVAALIPDGAGAPETARQAAEAEAIAARVRPILESTRTEFQIRAVPCLSRQGGKAMGAVIASVHTAARDIRAVVLVVPAAPDAGVITTRELRLWPYTAAARAKLDVSQERP